MSLIWWIQCTKLKEYSLFSTNSRRNRSVMPGFGLSCTGFRIAKTIVCRHCSGNVPFIQISFWITILITLLGIVSYMENVWSFDWFMWVFNEIFYFSLREWFVLILQVLKFNSYFSAFYFIVSVCLQFFRRVFKNDSANVFL